jgi:hypothetical protein
MPHVRIKSYRFAIFTVQNIRLPLQINLLPQPHILHRSCLRQHDFIVFSAAFAKYRRCGNPQGIKKENIT